MTRYQNKKVLHSKGNDQQSKITTHRMGEHICHSTNKGLISKIYKEHLKFKTNKQKSPHTMQ